MNRLKFYKPPESTEEAYEYFMESPPDFIGTLCDASLFLTNTEPLKALNMSFSITRVIDYTYEGHIAYTIYPGTSEMFSLFYRFDSLIIIGLILTLITLSIVLSLKHRSVTNFIRVFIECSSILFSKEMPSSLRIECSAYRCVLAAWLLASMFISIVFCNLILVEKFKTVPKNVINSWNDLFLRKEVEIVAIDLEYFNQYFEDDNSQIALNFRSRLKLMRYEDSTTPKFIKSLGKNISFGRTAFITRRLN